MILEELVLRRFEDEDLDRQVGIDVVLLMKATKRRPESSCTTLIDGVLNLSASLAIRRRAQVGRDPKTTTRALPRVRRNSKLNGRNVIS
jgi:hypothetical protein